MCIVLNVKMFSFLELILKQDASRRIHTDKIRTLLFALKHSYFVLNDQSSEHSKIKLSSHFEQLSQDVLPTDN